MQSKDPGVWQMVFKWYALPLIATCGKTKPKPLNQWDENDYNASKWNSLGHNAISCSISEEVFKKIYVCTTSKQAYDTLAIIHEGTNTVKNSKIKRLTTDFENVMMSNNETFEQFHGNLKDIANSLYNLGEPQSKSRIVKKILRSLLAKFIIKITAIE